MLRSREATPEEIEKTGLIHRVYVSETCTAWSGPRPLVLMVHGRAGTSRVMWIFSKALERIKPIVVAPQAAVPDTLGGFSWWDVSHPPHSESPLPSQTKKADLEAPLDKLRVFAHAAAALYGGDIDQLYAVGFSQGAACIASLAIREPRLFKGVAMLSGFIPRSVVQQTQISNERFKGGPKFFVAHGTRDHVIPFARAEETRTFLEQNGAEVEFCGEPTGHKTGSSGIKALRSWFENGINRAV